MGLKDSLPCSQEPATLPCPEPDESSSHPHILFLKICFNVTEFPANILYAYLISFIRAKSPAYLTF
jgi:hypothetical protein